MAEIVPLYVRVSETRLGWPRHPSGRERGRPLFQVRQMSWRPATTLVVGLL